MSIEIVKKAKNFLKKEGIHIVWTISAPGLLILEPTRLELDAEEVVGVLYTTDR